MAHHPKSCNHAVRASTPIRAFRLQGIRGPAVVFLYATQCSFPCLPRYLAPYTHLWLLRAVRCARGPCGLARRHTAWPKPEQSAQLHRLFNGGSQRLGFLLDRDGDSLTVTPNGMDAAFSQRALQRRPGALFLRSVAVSARPTGRVRLLARTDRVFQF